MPSNHTVKLESRHFSDVEVQDYAYLKEMLDTIHVFSTISLIVTGGDENSLVRVNAVRMLVSEVSAIRKLSVILVLFRA